MEKLDCKIQVIEIEGMVVWSFKSFGKELKLVKDMVNTIGAVKPDVVLVSKWQFENVLNRYRTFKGVPVVAAQEKGTK